MLSPQLAALLDVRYLRLIRSSTAGLSDGVFAPGMGGAASTSAARAGGGCVISSDGQCRQP
jgi:hypothetical protein